MFLKNIADVPLSFSVTYNGMKLPKTTVSANTIHPILVNYELKDGTKIVYSIPRILGISYLRDGTPRLIVWGELGRKERIKLESPDGTSSELEIQYPKIETAFEYTIGNIQILAVNRATAGCTWIMNEDGKNVVIIGPDFVRKFSFTNTEKGYNLDAEYHRAKNCFPFFRHLIIYVDKEKLTESLIKPARPPSPPNLKKWKFLTGSPEQAIEFDDTSWISMEEPKDMLELGNYWYEYGWYRTEIKSPSSGRSTLKFTNISDRIILFVNGKMGGEIEYPSSGEIEVELQKGNNILSVLANSLSITHHPTERDIRKGIYGPVFIKLPGEDEFAEVKSWHFRKGLYGEIKGWDLPECQGELSWKSLEERPSEPKVVWYKTTFDLDKTFLSPSNPIMLRMDGMLKGDIWINGHHIGRYWQIGPQRDYYLPSSWMKEKGNLLIIAEERGELAQPESMKLIWPQEREMGRDSHWRK